MLSFLTTTVYIQLSPELLTLKNFRTGEVLAEVPEVALSQSPQGKVLAVGAMARHAAASQAARLLNPFAHPRSMVSDFALGQQVLKHQMRRVLGTPFLRPAPRVVFHLLGTPDGGFTQVERRAFHEMALGAGAGEVVVWSGRPLTEAEVLSPRFFRDAGQPE